MGDKHGGFSFFIVFLSLYYRNFGIARVEDGGYGRFLKKAPQKLFICVAGLLG
jgi:hypothetical protein